MILEAIAFGTVGFYVLLAVLTIFLIGLTEFSRPWISTIILSIFLVYYSKPLLVLAGSVGLWAILGGYIVVGVVWSLYKWRRHVRATFKEARDISSGLMAHINRNGPDFTQHFYTLINPSENKGMLYNWIAFWPWSFIWSITGGLFRNLYELLAGRYQAITDNAKKDLEAKILAEAKAEWKQLKGDRD